jgi:hypothetical protein
VLDLRGTGEVLLSFRMQSSNLPRLCTAVASIVEETGLYLLQSNVFASYAETDSNSHDLSSPQEPQSSLIFTTSSTTQFTSFRPDDIPYKDAKLSIFFETQEMMEDTLILLRFNCPDGGCDYIASGWSDLKLHLRAIHGMLTWYERTSSLGFDCGLNQPKQRPLHSDEENIRARTHNISSKPSTAPLAIYSTSFTAPKTERRRCGSPSDVRVLSGMYTW